MRAASLALAALLAAGCGKNRAEPAPRMAERVRVTKVEEVESRPEVETCGSLVYSSKADVHSPVEGRIEAVHVEEGDRVARGTLLASVATEALLLSLERAQSAVTTREADLRVAEARLQEGRREVEARLFRLRMAEAEIEMRRAEHRNLSSICANKRILFHAGGVPAGELEAMETRLITAGIAVELAEIDLQRQSVGFREADIREAGLEAPRDGKDFLSLLVGLNTRTLEAERCAARAELDAALTDLRRARLLLSEAQIRSPVEGIVGRRGVEPGDSITGGSPLFSIFSVETLHAVVDIGEKDLPRVAPGMTVEAFVGSFPPLTGQIGLVAPFVNPATKSAEVRIRVSNPSGRLRPGMFVRVTIPTGEAVRRLRIPASALVEEREGGYSALVLRNSRVFRTGVESPGPEGGFAFIDKGLSPGDLVVERPSPSLQDGILVEAVR